MFDHDGCQTGIEGLVQYRSEWDNLKGVQVKTPVPDWASHYADSFRYLAIGIAAGAHLDWDGILYDPREYRRGV